MAESEPVQQERIRNIWISGLLDPSKVRVSERYWLYTGKIDKMIEARKYTQKFEKFYESFLEKESWGSCISKCYKDFHGEVLFEWMFNPTSDTLPADVTFFMWRDNYKMTVIDTPDHVDFTAEVLNALHAIDAAVLVLSSVDDGTQRHSISVDKQMTEYQLPRLVFINNLDHKGADPWKVINQARSNHQRCTAAVQVPIGLGHSFKGLVDLVQSKAYFFHGSNGEKVVVKEVPVDMEALVSEKRHELIKTVSEVDDKLAEAFNGEKPVSTADLQEAVRRATISQKFIPVFMGSVSKYKKKKKHQKQQAEASKGAYPTRLRGLKLLLDGVLDYLPCPTEASNYALIQSMHEEKHTLVARAFTLNRKYDPVTYLRIYDGVLRKGDFITNINTGKTFKVPDSIEVRKDEIGVPYSYEVKEDEMGVPYVIGLNKEVPYSIEMRREDFGVPHMVGMTFAEVIREARAGEIVVVHDVINTPGDTFTNGLVRYTKASSIDVS